jgi:carbamate kinase
MRVLVALGGNAIAAADGSAGVLDQLKAVDQAAEAVVDLIGAGHDVLVTHGNGPQVGAVLVQNELAAHEVEPVPLDWCGAQTQGSLGFILLGALDGALRRAGSSRRTAAVVTRTLVSRTDAGFASPTKPVGRFLPRADAQRFVALGQRWEDRGERGWRRLVASPEPIEIVDAPAIRALADAGLLVVAGGGGGVPVAEEPDGTLSGVEAVIDKDLAAVVLAAQVGADALVIATDVENAVVGWGTPAARPLGRVTVSELRDVAAEGHFTAGSMGPKVEAACRFVEAGGRMSIITSMNRMAEALAGDVGTIVVPDPAS